MVHNYSDTPRTAKAFDSWHYRLHGNKLSFLSLESKMLKIVFAVIVGLMVVTNPGDGVSAFAAYKDYVLALIIAFLVHPLVVRQFE